MSDYGLCDGWRYHHPDCREYTFFLHVHHSYSCLDYYLVSSSLLRHCFRHLDTPKAVSDHAPVSLILVIKKVILPSKNWRFNKSLLKDERQRRKEKTSIQELEETNKSFSFHSFG